MKGGKLWGGTVIFFFNDTATTEIYTLSLHDALPISRDREMAENAGVSRFMTKPGANSEVLSAVRELAGQ